MSVMTRPMVRVSRRFSARAMPDGRYARSRAAASTRSRVSGRAGTDPERTRLTVAVETPDRAATSPMVTAATARRTALLPTKKPVERRTPADGDDARLLFPVRWIERFEAPRSGVAAGAERRDQVGQ